MEMAPLEASRGGFCQAQSRMKMLTKLQEEAVAVGAPETRSSKQILRNQWRNMKKYRESNGNLMEI